MYCKPANCYCARILGGINQDLKDKVTLALRPEKIKIEKSSEIKLIVEKSLFQGKEYNIKAKYEDEVWNLFSSVPYKKNDTIYKKFNDEDLIYSLPVNSLLYSPLKKWKLGRRNTKAGGILFLPVTITGLKIYLKRLTASHFLKWTNDLLNIWKKNLEYQKMGLSIKLTKR